MSPRSWVVPGGSTGPIDIALRLTLVALLLRPMSPWYVRAFVLVIAVLALAGSGLRAPVTWLALAGLTGARLVVEWPLPDNHVYLLAYWCLGVGIALMLTAPPRALAHTGRLLLGLAFASAVVWKAGSPDYRDGRFFAVTLLTDDRFADAVRLFGGLSEAQLAESRDYLTPLPEGAELMHPPRLHMTRRVRWLVQGATWGGLALESLIAVLWLAPLRSRGLLRARHGAVLLFCLTTYAFAPVAGFGWLILAMGLAASAEDQRRIRAAYVGSFCVVLLYAEIPWTSLLVAGLQP